MAFELFKCKGPKGLPLIEVPDGPLFAERLSPGEIREADFFDNFRRTKRGDVDLLFACPKGKSKKSECQVPLRVLRIWHEKGKGERTLKKFITDCRSGKLSERRMDEIEKIRKDVGVETPGLGETGEDKVTFEKIALFILGGVVSTIVAITVIRTFFPEGIFVGSENK
jgi:hypothetical protein